MIKKYASTLGVVIALLAGWSTTLYASNADSLVQQRVQVLKRYVTDLGALNATDISTIYTPDATAYTDDNGKKNAVKFYESILPKVKYAHTSLGAIYHNNLMPNEYVVDFQLIYIMKDGSTGGGEFSDRFIFANGKTQIQTGYMHKRIK